MYNVAKSTNRRVVTRREKYTVKTRLGLKPRIYTSPLNWDLKLRQECSMLNQNKLQKLSTFLREDTLKKVFFLRVSSLIGLKKNLKLLFMVVYIYYSYEISFSE